MAESGRLCAYELGKLGKRFRAQGRPLYYSKFFRPPAKWIPAKTAEISILKLS